MYLSHSVLNALRCYLRLKWYFPEFVPLSASLMPCPSLPHSLLFLWRAPGKGWRAWGPILPPTLFWPDHRQCRRSQNHNFLNLWLDVGLCDFLQWQPTEWRVMFEISGLHFLPPPRWISRITPQHQTTFWNIQTNVISGDFPGNKSIWGHTGTLMI